MAGRWATRRLLQHAVVLLILTALPVSALDAKLHMTEPQALKGQVESASLVIAAANKKKPQSQDVVAAARADYANILGILYGAGYYAGSISIKIDGQEAANLSPFSVPKKITSVDVRVDPGPPFEFGTASIGPLAPGSTQPDSFATGKPALSGVIQQAVGSAVTGWEDQGYAKAQAGARKITANIAAKTLNVTIKIDPGPKLRFGNMSVAGNRNVRAKRIREITGFPAGKVYSPALANDAATRLRDSGAFRSVALEQAKTANPNDTLDYKLTVVEDKPRRFGLGAEYATTEGLGLNAYWMHRNIFHGAERLRFDASISGIGGTTGGLDYTLGATLTRPGTFSPYNTLTLGFTLSQLNQPDYTAKLARLDASMMRKISDRLEFSYGVSLLRENADDDLGLRRYTMVLFPLTGLWDDRDNILNAKNGTYVSLEAEPYLGFQDGESGARLFADARYYITPGKQGRVTLAARLQLGSVVGSSIRATPPDLLFFAGGGGTIRGQSYESLNVPLPGGGSTGGRNLIATSGEVRVGVTKAIQIVGFYDWGFVGASSTPGQQGSSEAGAGLGLRYDTSFGPIRLDVGAPVGGKGSGVQVYVGIGQAF